MDREQWLDEQDKLLTKGEQLTRKASDEALEYLQDIIENRNELEWRKLAVSQHALEIGVAEAFRTVVINKIYNSMPKHFRKTLKANKQGGEMLARIYIGRVVQNIVKEINNETDSRG